MKYKILLLAALFFIPAFAQNDTTMSFEEYDPPSTLVVPEHKLTHSKYPFIDIHNHQFDLSKDALGKVVEDMDKLNMAVMNNLSGRGFKRTASGGFGYQDQQYLKDGIEVVKQNFPGRITYFTNVDFNGIDMPGWVDKALKELEEDIKSGAVGLKIYKSLGFSYKDSTGKLIAVDDSRIDPIWEKCGELGIPVLIHTGEPASFWQPKDKNNERWLELKIHPERYRDPKVIPSWEELIKEQHNVFRKHPHTNFIDAHLGWLGNNLDELGKLMDELPNVYTEIGAVLAELGRQPIHAREFFIKHQDRIMFGKDSWEPSEYYTYFRVLETNDEYFDYYRRYHAFWKMYGLGLPDEVLKKVYYKNALKLLPMIDKSKFPE